jgi:hypothetical protein
VQLNKCNTSEQKSKCVKDHEYHKKRLSVESEGDKKARLQIDCERSLLSAGLDFRACERKGATADNTSRNEIRVAHTTQNSHWSKSIRLSIKSDTW